MSIKLIALIATLTLTLAPCVISAPQYGELCNSLLQCNRYTENFDQGVICMYRANDTEPTGYCNMFAVPVGRCHCARNCGAFNDYHDDGEFVPELGRCVGYVGSFCFNGWGVNDCVENAYCPGISRHCVCNLGFETGPDGKHCVAIKVEQDTLFFLFLNNKSI